MLLAEIAVDTYFELILEYNTYVTLVPLTYFAFGLALQIRIPSESTVFRSLRTISTLIFFIHLLVSRLVETVFALFGTDITVNGLFYLFTVSGSILISWGILRLSAVRGFGWLKKIC